jgi:Kef-type K+ transport system membrane component KefB
MEIFLWPEWPPRFGMLLLLAAALLVAALAGELVRRAGLPRIGGYVLAGLALGPLALGWFSAAELAGYRAVLDLVLLLLLFELGMRLDVRWFVANPWVLAGSLAEAALTFALSFAALWALKVDIPLAFAVAAIAVGTSPVVVMRVCAELRAEGQVTARLLTLCALNVAYSVVLLKFVLAGLYGMHEGPGPALQHSAYLLFGSLVAGMLLAAAFALLRRVFDPGSEQSLAATLGLLMAALAVLMALRLPALLAPLVAGALIRWRDPRLHPWPPQFAGAGGVLAIVLCLFTGAAGTPAQLQAGLAAGLAVAGARALGKIGGVMLFGPASGLGLRKSFALGLALQPLAGVAVVLAEDVRLLYPAFGDGLMNVVVVMMVVLGAPGAIAAQWALMDSRERRPGDAT